MQISINTKVVEQTAGGYAKYYAKHLLRGYYIWLIITSPIPIVAVPFYYHRLFPNVTLSVPMSIMIYTMLAMVMAAMGAVEYLGYERTMSGTMRRMKTFYTQREIFGGLLIQVGDEALQIKSEKRTMTYHYHHGGFFYRRPLRVRKVYQCPDVLYFLVGVCYYVIPAWDCAPGEWETLCSFLKQEFGRRYIRLQKPVFPDSQYEA